MSGRRYAISLSKSEDATLREQYDFFRFSTDQLNKRPREAAMFADTWNYATGRSDSADELVHYMITQRKQKRKNWPNLGDSCKKLPPAGKLLTADEDESLRQIYTRTVVPLDIGTDTFFLNRKLVATVAKELTKAIGRRVPDSLLIAYIEAKRKRGEWIALRRDRGINFGDMDEAAAM